MILFVSFKKIIYFCGSVFVFLRVTLTLELEDLDLILREKASLVWACGAF